MTMLRNNFTALLEPGLATVFFNEFDRYELEYPQYYKVRGSEKRKETEQDIIGFGIMASKPEGIGTSYEDISQGFSRDFTHTTFSKGARISQEMIEDDLYGAMDDMVSALARSAYQRMEVDGADVFNNAFSSSFTGSDGVSLINSAHPLSIGGTQSNAISVPGDLTVATLQEAISIMEKTLDEKGLNLAIRPQLLIVPPDLQFTAGELLASVYKPGTTDNEVNVIRGKGLDYLTCHYLTDTGAWFLQGDLHRMVWWNRTEMQFYKGNDFDTDDCKYKARFRKSNGFSGWRGIVGST